MRYRGCEKDRVDNLSAAQAVEKLIQEYGKLVFHTIYGLMGDRDAVQRSMQQLAPSLRECLLLSIIGQFSTAEISRMLDIEEAAVRQRLARARKQFQQLYAQVGGEELIDTQSPISPSDMSQNRLPRHHSHIERVESRVFNAHSQP